MEHDARRVPIGDLKTYGKNPRKGDVAAIRESLRANGQYRPLVVRRKTSEVLAGNHTLLAAREEGWSEVWATFVDVDAKQAKRIVLVDNRTNDLAAYDDQALAELIGELPDLTGTGYDEDAVRELVARTVLADAEPPSDEAPEPPEEPETKPGDLYLLGEHRLLCGDATVATDVERLMAGALHAATLLRVRRQRCQARGSAAGGWPGCDEKSPAGSARSSPHLLFAWSEVRSRRYMMKVVPRTSCSL